jgi:hypothetical protein
VSHEKTVLETTMLKKLLEKAKGLLHFSELDFGQLMHIMEKIRK